MILFFNTTGFEVLAKLYKLTGEHQMSSAWLCIVFYFIFSPLILHSTVSIQNLNTTLLGKTKHCKKCTLWWFNNEDIILCYSITKKVCKISWWPTHGNFYNGMILVFFIVDHQTFKTNLFEVFYSIIKIQNYFTHCFL